MHMYELTLEQKKKQFTYARIRVHPVSPDLD